MKRRLNIRRCRRYVPYLLIPLALLVGSPVSLQTHVVVDMPLDIAGGIVAFVGVALRFWAWGSNPPGPHLRLSGPYAFMRHPLYLGNFLVALGLLMIFNVPLAYLIVLPSLVLLYWFVARAEEMKLEEKMGRAYREYSRKVPSFVPRLNNGLKGSRPFRLDWKQALRKEGQTVCGLVAGAIGLEVYGEFLSHGFSGTRKESLYYGTVPLLALGLLSFFFHRRRSN